MNPLQLAVAASLALITPQITLANIQVSFIESAPKDSFIFTNIGECDLTNLNLEIDLKNSRGQLIFDTTATGAGVEVFQPFEVKTGKLTLHSATAVDDGDKTLSINVETLLPNTSVSFTIDVDDTLPNSSLGQIRVAGSEIEGAQVRINSANAIAHEGTFNAQSVTTVMLPSCN